MLDGLDQCPDFCESGSSWAEPPLHFCKDVILFEELTKPVVDNTGEGFVKGVQKCNGAVVVWISHIPCFIDEEDAAIMPFFRDDPCRNKGRKN